MKLTMMACLSALIFITSPLEAKSVADWFLLDTKDLTGGRVDDEEVHEIKDNGGVPSGQDEVDYEEVNEVKNTNEDEDTFNNEFHEEIKAAIENEDRIYNEKMKEMEFEESVGNVEDTDKNKDWFLIDTFDY